MVPQRRDLLKTLTALPVATVAGCTGVLDDGAVPDYAESLPRDGANDDDGVFFVHSNAEWLRGFNGEEELPYAEELPDAFDVDIDPDTPPLDADPLIAYPSAGLVLGALGIGFGLVPYGFGDLLLGGLDEEVAPNDTKSEQTSETDSDVSGTVRIDSMLLVDGVGIFRGEFDARTVVAAAGEFEPAGEQEEFDIYEGTDDGFLGTEELAFAVRDGVLVTRLDDGADIGAALGAIAGDAERLNDTDDGGWALTEAGQGNVTLGVWGVDPEQATEQETDRELVDTQDVFGDADGLVSSLTLDPEEGVGTITAVFPAEQTPQRAALESRIGTSASTREIEIDGTRVSIAGIWRVPDETNDDS
ncbi:hypothetical protein [Natronomonas salsuginis]|uniref:Uncharacterized protein n=1 Tax=Natronomonas salsuginis TaxID=2217661 RepID=A0A4U5JEZ6_9EURY|nr:hypothetical protein [Natronomonas salsuginis]TKR26257.1 hypothetical protein DM868_07125 [Natronomonas salsuginis]